MRKSDAAPSSCVGARIIRAALHSRREVNTMRSRGPQAHLAVIEWYVGLGAHQHLDGIRIALRQHLLRTPQDRALLDRRSRTTSHWRVAVLALAALVVLVQIISSCLHPVGRGTLEGASASHVIGNHHTVRIAEIRSRERRKAFLRQRSSWASLTLGRGQDSWQVRRAEWGSSAPAPLCPTAAAPPRRRRDRASWWTRPRQSSPLNCRRTGPRRSAA